MAELCASMDTILQMLDDLDKEIATLRALAASAPASRFAAVSPSRLRSEMDRARLTTPDFGRIAGVPRLQVEEWLKSKAPTPAWALTIVQLVILLPPSARRKLLQQPLRSANPTRSTNHPFSRIEDL